MFTALTAEETVAYLSNPINQYTKVGDVTPAYDARGNLTDDGSFLYTFDRAREADVRSEARNVKIV